MQRPARQVEELDLEPAVGDRRRRRINWYSHGPLTVPRCLGHRCRRHARQGWLAIDTNAKANRPAIRHRSLPCRSSAVSGGEWRHSTAPDNDGRRPRPGQRPAGWGGFGEGGYGGGAGEGSPVSATPTSSAMPKPRWLFVAGSGALWHVFTPA